MLERSLEYDATAISWSIVGIASCRGRQRGGVIMKLLAEKSFGHLRRLSQVKVS